MLRATSMLFVLFGVVIQMVPAYCQTCCPTCGCSCDPSCLVEKTIMVPTIVTVQRMQSCLIEKTEEREQTYTVFKRVPVTKKYYSECCYLDDEVKTKTIEDKKCQIVDNRVIVNYKVQVPVEEFHYRDPCCCPNCDCCCCPNCDCCCGKNGTMSGVAGEGCMCKVTRLATEMRTAERTRPDVVFVTEKCDIDYCVKVPKKRKELCTEETVYKLEPVEKKRKVTVCVPEYVKNPVDVQVCKMLPKTIWCCQECCRRH